MTGLGAGDAGPTGDLQVQVDEPEPDSLPSQVGHPLQPPSHPRPDPDPPGFLCDFVPLCVCHHETLDTGRCR